MTLKIAVLAPIPSANVTTAVAANTGLLRSIRKACLKSLSSNWEAPMGYFDVRRGVMLRPGQLVDLGGKNEVVFAEAADLVRKDLDVHFAPGQAKIGVMALLFGHLADAHNEIERGLEIAKRKRFLEVVFVYSLPRRQAALERFQLGSGKPRCSSVARRTMFFRKLTHSRSPHRMIIENDRRWSNEMSGPVSIP